MARNFVPVQGISFLDNAAYDVSEISIFVWAKSDLGDDGTNKFIYNFDLTTASRWGMRAFTSGGNNAYQSFLRNSSDGLIPNGGSLVGTSGVDTNGHALGTTYDGTTARLYYEGVEEDSEADTDTLTTITNNGFVGQHPTGGSTVAWDGWIAHFVVWGATLSANEMLALSRGVNPFAIRFESQVINVPLHGNNAPEQDISPTHNNGIVIGATKINTGPPVELIENYM